MPQKTRQTTERAAEVANLLAYFSKLKSCALTRARRLQVDDNIQASAHGHLCAGEVQPYAFSYLYRIKD